MRRTVLFLMLIVTALSTSAGRAQPTSPRQAAVRAVVDLYFKGHATGDGTYFSKAFHPDAKLFWIGADGAVMQRPVADYIRAASGRPAADESLRKRRIVSIDITGNVAMVKVELDYPATKFTDYFAMAEDKGQWKIVNKTYFAERRQ